MSLTKILYSNLFVYKGDFGDIGSLTVLVLVIIFLFIGGLSVMGKKMRWWKW